MSDSFFGELSVIGMRGCEKFVEHVQKGVFGAHMDVSLVNDGPFTIVLDSAEIM